jgi:hypothetical protein
MALLSQHGIDGVCDTRRDTCPSLIRSIKSKLQAEHLLSRQYPAGGALRSVGLGLCILAAPGGVALADGPGRGATAHFEQHYLTFIIDHHYSALRMTELAAGTDPMRDAQVVAPQEGTSPTPRFAATPAKIQRRRDSFNGPHGKSRVA